MTTMNACSKNRAMSVVSHHHKSASHWQQSLYAIRPLVNHFIEWYASMLQQLGEGALPLRPPAWASPLDPAGGLLSPRSLTWCSTFKDVPLAAASLLV